MDRTKDSLVRLPEGLRGTELSTATIYRTEPLGESRRNVHRSSRAVACRYETNIRAWLVDPMESAHKVV